MPSRFAADSIRGVVVFGRRKREEAEAAEAAREGERLALFAKLAERPEHICPFLGLEGDRTGYVEGVSEEHRCFAFGDPAPISAEQQTRVCQERGYGNCPRYLRGVLVIPTEELEALRRPRAAEPVAAPVVPPPPPPERRRRVPAWLFVIPLLLLVGGGAWVLMGGLDEIGGVTPTASPSVEPTSVATVGPTPAASASGGTSAEPSPSAAESGPPTPSAEPTPSAGDTFAFYEVSVGPEGYTLYTLSASGEIADTREASFGRFSFARVEPVEGSENTVYWETQDGDLAGWSYRWPNSGDFRIRAVYLSSSGERRSEYLEQSELRTFPEATPAP
jgi:hypothetical protein